MPGYFHFASYAIRYMVVPAGKAIGEYFQVLFALARIEKARGRPKPTEAFECPSCTLLVPPTSSKCPDCGYRFEWQETSNETKN